MAEPWQEPESERDDERHLPRGVVPLPPGGKKGPGGCGLVGCLYGTVIVFGVLLVILLIAIATRIWITTPMPRM
jgi:uncharacterized membrane protein